MRCPSVSEIPPAPAGKEGWPWTVESARLDDTMPDGGPWPKISIVTPSYNQADFLEETVRSVLLQGYPNLEYVVIDGGSQDGSVEIIEKYSPWLAHWVSEPDRGQSHAINKGFDRATGEVFAWLNSDDIYYPDALRTVALGMMGSICDIFLGAMDKVVVHKDRVDYDKLSLPSAGEPIHFFPILASGRWHRFHFFQPSMFWTRDVWTQTGGLDEQYEYMMDMEWCNRALACGAEVVTSSEVLTRFTLHPGSKSQDFAYMQRQEEAIMYWRLSRLPEFRRFQCLLASLWPAQRSLSMRAAKARRDGQPLRATLLRVGARLVRTVSIGVGGHDAAAASGQEYASNV